MLLFLLLFLLLLWQRLPFSLLASSPNEAHAPTCQENGHHDWSNSTDPTCATHSSGCASMRPSCGASVAARAGPRPSGQPVKPSLCSDSTERASWGPDKDDQRAYSSSSSSSNGSNGSRSRQQSVKPSLCSDIIDRASWGPDRDDQRA